MTDKTYCGLSAVLFGLVGLLHLTRAVNQWAFQIGPIAVPLWLSWMGGAAGIALGAWGMSLARGRR